MDECDIDIPRQCRYKIIDSTCHCNARAYRILLSGRCALLLNKFGSVMCIL